MAFIFTIGFIFWRFLEILTLVSTPTIFTHTPVQPSSRLHLQRIAAHGMRCARRAPTWADYNSLQMQEPGIKVG